MAARRMITDYFGGLSAGPDLLPGSPGTLLWSGLTPVVGWVGFCPCFTAGPDLFPGWPATPAPLFGDPVVCARAAGPARTRAAETTVASVLTFFISFSIRPSTAVNAWIPPRFEGTALRKWAGDKVFEGNLISTFLVTFASGTEAGGQQCGS
jgi:hypothetical protein